MDSIGRPVESTGHSSDTPSDHLQMPHARIAILPESQPHFGTDYRAHHSDMLGYRSGLRDSQQSFNALFHSLRYEAGLTLQQVADAVGVSKPTVWGWENGRAKPGRAKLQAIAKALGVAPDLLASAARKHILTNETSSNSEDNRRNREALIAEARSMIAEAYEITPSAVRIFVEIDVL